MEIEAYLESLASAAPAPGGGSAAALVGAAGAALVAMVARITLANAKLAAVHPAAERLVEQADGLRAELLAARGADESAYGAVVTASALPRATAEERAVRTARLQGALAEAARVPLTTAARTLDVLEAARAGLALENAQLASDLGCAAEFASAALRACAFNVRINHAYLQDAVLVTDQAAALARLERAAENALRDVRAAF